MADSNSYPGIDEYDVMLVQYNARRLIKQPGFCREDQPDIEQELMLELIKRHPTYDRSKASRHTFVARILKRKTTDMIRARLAQKRNSRAETTSLNDSVQVEEDGSREEKWATVNVEEYLQLTGSIGLSREERIDLGIDIDRMMMRLPEDLRRLCELLTEKNISQVSRETGIPRATLYFAIRKIRKLFEEAGMEDYL